MPRQLEGYESSFEIFTLVEIEQQAIVEVQKFITSLTRKTNKTTLHFHLTLELLTNFGKNKAESWLYSQLLPDLLKN